MKESFYHTVSSNQQTNKASGHMQQSNVDVEGLYALAKADRQAYWHLQAQKLHWFAPYHTLMQGTMPHVRWFEGGELNLSYNCLDRHMPQAAERVALYCVDEQLAVRTVTYQELFEQVCACALALKHLGVRKGDRVAIYMPMTAQAIIAMLACARIGAIHTVVFGGFSAQALADRINDAAARVVITADGTIRKGSVLAIKDTVDQALTRCPEVKKVLVVHNSDLACTMESERDVWYHELIAEYMGQQIAAEPMKSEDIAFILYTSGTTGKPKGIVHTVGGYAVGAASSTQLVFDPQATDIYWCTADVGWITGHTYVAYGPLMLGMSQVIYEGALSHPHKGVIWQLIDRIGVTMLYTAPTAIRMFSQWGNELPAAYSLQSLRLLGSVGEPLNPEAWQWYYTHVGREHCPIVDTWWQTETGSIMICSVPTVHTGKPGYVGKPLPGIEAVLLNEIYTQSVDSYGYLAIKQPWPSMMRGIWADEQRFCSTYFGPDYSCYITGDAALKDADGDFMMMGRVDDVLNVSGHRIGTMEIESALVEHPAVAEAAVVAKPDALKGQVPIAFVILKGEHETTSALVQGILAQVTISIGTLARPDMIVICPDLPKTRSGKIMRRLLKDMVHERPLSDTTTLANPDTVATVATIWQAMQQQG